MVPGYDKYIDARVCDLLERSKSHIYKTGGNFTPE
jgi:hypothetical protein